MAGVLIYKNVLNQHYSFVAADDDVYNAIITDLSRNKDNVLWGKGNVSLEQIEKARTTKNNLVMKLNEGEEVDLKKELDCFFN
jgi:hypothetical protein